MDIGECAEVTVEEMLEPAGLDTLTGNDGYRSEFVGGSNAVELRDQVSFKEREGGPGLDLRPRPYGIDQVLEEADSVVLSSAHASPMLAPQVGQEDASPMIRAVWAHPGRLTSVSSVNRTRSDRAAATPTRMRMARIVVVIEVVLLGVSGSSVVRSEPFMIRDADCRRSLTVLSMCRYSVTVATISMAMLEVHNVWKRFGGIEAIRGVSVTVDEGTVTGLIGPNGAGKTTLFNLVTGIEHPDRGSVTYCGERIDGLRPDQIYARRLYRTFQTPREFETMTVLENLMLIPAGQAGEVLPRLWFSPQRVRNQEIANYERCLEVLDFVDLSDHADEHAGSLSGGQRKLLELARTMMADPKLVLLDEPGAGVNPTLLKRIVEKIRALAAGGITFLLIEHDMDVIMSLCDPVIVMSEGRELVEGSPDYVRKHEAVLDAYLGTR